MHGVGIFDGDLLIVDCAVDVSTGDVVVATYNSCFVCKLIHNEKRLLMSASDEYALVYISPEDGFCLGLPGVLGYISLVWNFKMLISSSIINFYQLVFY